MLKNKYLKQWSCMVSEHLPHLSIRVDSFKLSTADFESINLTEDSQVYLSLTKRVSHNN
jgi:hypothetical protein